MLLDLWTFSSVLNDVLDLVSHQRDNGTISIGFLLCCLAFTFITYLVWRSTDIPADVPPAPSPPFMITIQNSNQGGGTGLRRQNLSDIRVITSDTYTDFVSRYSRVRRRVLGDILREPSPPLPTTPAQENLENTSSSTGSNSSSSSSLTRTLQQQVGRSFILGFLRHPLTVTRGLAPTRLALNLLPHNIFLTGRVFRLQHRHRRSTPSRPQSPTPESPENQSPATPSSTDGQHQTEGLVLNSSDINSETSHTSRPSSEVNTEPNSVLNQASSDHHHMPSADMDPTNRGNPDSASDDTKTSSEATDAAATASGTTQPFTSSPTTDATTAEAAPELKFTLKFLNDTQIEVSTHSGEKIGDFKRRHFSRELSENKIVRLIFNGRVLDPDSRTLQECGIFDQCVVHCLVVTPQQSTSQSGNGSSSIGGRNSNARGGHRGPEPGMFFMSFVGIILMFMWFVCINFGNHLFTQSAVVSLSILTIMFGAGIFTFYAPFQQQQQPNNNNVNNVNT